MTSLHVICGLGPPQSKILATPMYVILLVKVKIVLNSSQIEVVTYTISTFSQFLIV